MFSKRSKNADSFYPSKDFTKPQNFFLAKSASTSNIINPLKAAAPRPRTLLQPKSPAAKLNSGIAKSSPLSAPAGRSPTRGKRAGLLSSRRRTAGPYTRVDPPGFGLGASTGSSSAPFSLDAALKGTIPSYSKRSSATVASSSRSADLGDLHSADSKTDWFFDIHEDSPEQEMTNLLQHSTCVLDISSDEESETRLLRERAEGKENVPPADDTSQTSQQRAARATADIDDMIFEQERNPLGEMNVRDFYANGCDESSIIIVPGDDDDEAKTDCEHTADVQIEQVVPVPEIVLGDLVKLVSEDGAKTIDELMQKMEEPAASAALLQPIEGTGESFEVWESGSATDGIEAVVVC